jgi:CheY-like chemotaxis protein
LKKKNITLVLDFPPDEVFVKGNESEIYRVFMNLGINAIHAIEEKKKTKLRQITIKINLNQNTDHHPWKLKAGMYYHIQFIDTGCGMEDHVKENAFIPMFTTKERSENKGQGLGLTMVYNIITNRHHGYLNIDSAPGKGTIFNIYLPRVKELKQKNKITTRLQKGKGQILVVDDEKGIRNLLSRLLHVLGYSAICVSSGKKALNIFEKEHKQIDIVLLDLAMPKMTGDQIYQAMLKIDPHVKVIVVSGYSLAQQKELINVKHYLTKPFSVTELSKVLKSALKKKKI